MAHQGSGARVLHLDINNTSSMPLYRQVYTQIRSRILSGALAGGTVVPSSRALATDLDVSRSTIVLAYEQLRAEGYIDSRHGGRTRVACVPPEIHTPPFTPAPARCTAASTRRSASRHPTNSVVHDFAGGTPPYARAFRCAVPALDVFPIELWSRTLSRCLRRMPPRHLAYGDAFGHRPLRQALAEYLTTARGVHCSADQIMIVNGAQQALSLCAGVLLEAGDQAWVEDPGYFGGRTAIASLGAEPIPVPVDHDGLDVRYGVEHAPRARAAFVTPSRQLPLGVTMSLKRRMELLVWANGNDAWIVEDDYDSEFRYASRPLGALQGLDHEGSVVYTGTFSKVMFPAMRLGYVVVPDALHDAFRALKRSADMQSPYLEQAAMAEFIAEGHFERHIRRTRRVYAARMEALLAGISSTLNDRLTVRIAEAGMSLVAWLREDDDERALVRAASSTGVDLLPLGELTLRHRMAPAVVLGFSGIPEPEIGQGITQLAAAFAAYDRDRRRAH